MFKRIRRKPNIQRPNDVSVALIGAGATIIAALITGIFGVLLSGATPQETRMPAMTLTSALSSETFTDLPASSPSSATPLSTSTSTPLPPSPTPVHLTVEIKGSPTAPLAECTYYTIITSNAVRGVWSVGGFQENKQFLVEPLAPSHRIYVQPTDATQLGSVITIVATVYSTDGQSATARKEFQIIANSGGKIVDKPCNESE